MSSIPSESPGPIGRTERKAAPPSHGLPEDRLGRIHVPATLDGIRKWVESETQSLSFDEWLRRALALNGRTEVDEDFVERLAAVTSGMIYPVIAWSGTPLQADQRHAPRTLSDLLALPDRAGIDGLFETAEAWQTLLEQAEYHIGNGAQGDRARALGELAAYAREQVALFPVGCGQKVDAAEVSAALDRLWQLLTQVRTAKDQGGPAHRSSSERQRA